MFLHKFDILNRNLNGLFQKWLPVCDEIMRRDEIRWFDGTKMSRIRNAGSFSLNKRRCCFFNFLGTFY